MNELTTSQGGSNHMGRKRIENPEKKYRINFLIGIDLKSQIDRMRGSDSLSMFVRDAIIRRLVDGDTD